ncbi:MAG TPA: hypothetical protein VNF07_00950 [Acidimicrobiales bacterium]|nr:hypothetical protein [Acidimicrobiales bacterium]
MLAAEVIDNFLDDDDLTDAYVTLLIHAGIAAADVICCVRLGEHAMGERHVEAAQLLAAVDKGLADDLATLLGLKIKSGYSHNPVSADDVRRVQRAAKRLVETARATV